MGKFFKSEWFRCISVLLVLAVTLGGLLAVLSDLLYVSAEQRTMRAVKKIYGVEKKYETILDIDVNQNQTAIPYDFGKINKIFKIVGQDAEHYDLLFQAVGFDGYKGGTITLWVKVSVDSTSSNCAIDKVVLESYEKQTLMSKLTNAYYSNFKLTDVTTAYKNEEFFTTLPSEPNSNPITGATYSANAGNNAVNCVITYVGQNIGGVQ